MSKVEEIAELRAEIARLNEVVATLARTVERLAESPWPIAVPKPWWEVPLPPIITFTTTTNTPPGGYIVLDIPLDPPGTPVHAYAEHVGP